MTAIVKCRRISKSYRQGKVTVDALQDVDLTVETGGFIALAGPSGSGKTTLLNLIGGLDRPDSGTIQVDDQDYENLSAAQMADLRLHRIGFIFQAYNLIPVLSAVENVEYVMLLQGIPAKTNAGKRPARFWTPSAYPIDTTVARPNCPAASSSGWLSHVQLWRGLPSSWPTNPRPIWIQKPESVFSN
jgi:ABC-type sugar transport system ATPase subunit